MMEGIYISLLVLFLMISCIGPPQKMDVDVAEIQHASFFSKVKDLQDDLPTTESGHGEMKYWLDL